MCLLTAWRLNGTSSASLLAVASPLRSNTSMSFLRLGSAMANQSVSLKGPGDHIPTPLLLQFWAQRCKPVLSELKQHLGTKLGFCSSSPDEENGKGSRNP